MTSVLWKDNKLVTLLSSYCCILPEETISRFDKKERKNIEMSCPLIIKEYNKHMGGVNLLDSLIGKYKIKMRSKKWYTRLWYYLIDVAVVNAWLLYRRVETSKGKKPTITLFDFRSEVAFSLTKPNVPTPKRGRPPLMVETQIATKRNRPHTSKLLSINIRKDSFDHWPDYKETRQRCKMPRCGN